jgi:hypothetical protein
VSHPEAAGPPRAVSRFEANLLEILQFFLRRQRAERVARRILEPCERPRCLSRTAVELVQDTLAKGCTALLARTGGWRKERHLRNGRVMEGRLWQRTDPEDLGLAFSRHTLDFLIWVTAEKLGDGKLRWWTATGKKLTTGDQLLLYYAYGCLRDPNLIRDLGTKSLFAGNALCRLAYPEDFAQAPADVTFSFEPWTTGVGACILEALQPELADRWLEVERGKANVISWRQMQAHGRSQRQVLEAFFDALEATGRRDLARFVLMVLAELLPEDATAERWLRCVTDRGPTIAERTQTGREALVLLRQLGRLRRWALEARGVAFFEENYVASQLYKSDWEHWQGETLHARAEAILRQVEPL